MGRPSRMHVEPLRCTNNNFVNNPPKELDFVTRPADAALASRLTWDQARRVQDFLS